jgi:Protein of unknown function (DUF2793)
MTETARLRLPEIAASQAQKHVTHNEALVYLDTLVQASVLDKDLTAPPGSPSEGDCYIVAGGGGTATGDWTSWEKRIARYQDGQWISFLPGEGDGIGWTVWVQDEATLYSFDGTNWMNALRGKTGGGISVQYVFSTTTADADPGNGTLRLNQATQNTATVIRADLADVNGTDWTAALASLADSSSTVKGHIRLFSVSDPSKWLLFTVSAVASPSGYKNITVAIVSSSAASPFANGDAIVLSFSRTGDAGANGTSGGSNSVCDFRLTLSTGVPVLTSDVLAATTLYCTPYLGSRIALYDGSSSWNIRQSAEFSISLSGLTANTNYDVFAYDNAGTPTLELLAWANDTARATALTRQDGVLVKSGATTRRLIGTLRTTGTTGQCEVSFGGKAAGGTAAKIYLWNLANPVEWSAFVGDTTTSWSYATNSWRAADNSTSMRVSYVAGQAGARVGARYGGLCNAGTTTPVGFGVGVDSTSAYSGRAGKIWHQNIVDSVIAEHQFAAAAGFHYVQALEYGATGATFYGNAGDATVQPTGLHVTGYY